MITMPVLPDHVEKELQGFLQQLQEAFGPDLVSAVLFGSAAEGSLRASSDINLLVILKDFQQGPADTIRERYRAAHAAVGLNVMFLLDSELAAAADCFAMKFSDMAQRHVVLYGADPFEKVEIPRASLVRHAQQALLNLKIRLRERYALVSLREEQLAAVIAGCASPLRSCAAAILRLEGAACASQKEALALIVGQAGEPELDELLAQISEARQNLLLAPGTAEKTLLQLTRIIVVLQNRIDALAKG